jgi:hypothetical protein
MMTKTTSDYASQREAEPPSLGFEVFRADEVDPVRGRGVPLSPGDSDELKIDETLDDSIPKLRGRQRVHSLPQRSQRCAAAVIQPPRCGTTPRTCSEQLVVERRGSYARVVQQRGSREVQRFPHG